MQEKHLRSLETEYETQRARNHAEEARRLAEASSAEPMIGTLVAERMRLFRDGARDALANPKGAGLITQQLTRRMAEIQSQLRDMLLSNGFTPDYLQPVYRCAVCHDTGFVGEVIRDRCECFTRQLRELAAGETGHGLNPAETFERYDENVYADIPLSAGGEETQRRFMGRLRVHCEAYVSQYPTNDRPNLLLFGASGLGKTYLLNCIGNRLRQQGIETYKITGYQLSKRMHTAVFDHQPESFTSLLEIPVLLLDDLGVEPMYNNITVEHLFTLLNERLLAGLHTLISTNLMLDELKTRYTERISSRLFDRRNTAIIALRGQDVRMR